MTNNIPYSLIGITGSRSLSNHHPLIQFIQSLPSDIIIVVGDCRGIDETAFSVAKKRGLSVIVKKADWASYGKAAGPIRNKQIIDEGIHALYAFPDFENSDCRGTMDCVRHAKQACIPVFFP